MRWEPQNVRQAHLKLSDDNSTTFLNSIAIKKSQYTQNLVPLGNIDHIYIKLSNKLTYTTQWGNGSNTKPH